MTEARLPPAHAVDWKALLREQERSLDVPALLEALTSADKRRRKAALASLTEAVSQRGHLDEAAVPLVPYLWQATDRSEAPARRAILNALRELIVGEHESSWCQLLATLEAAPENTEALRLVRVRRAVAEGLLARVELLDAPERELREAALFLASCLGEFAAQLIPSLLAYAASSALTTPQRAQFLLTIGDLLESCSVSLPGVEADLAPFLASEERDLRAAAAVALRGQAVNARTEAISPTTQAQVTQVLLASLTTHALAKVNWQPAHGRELVGLAVTSDIDTLSAGLAVGASASLQQATLRHASGPMYRSRSARERLVPMLLPALRSSVSAAKASAIAIVACTGGHARRLALDPLAEALERAMARVDLERVPAEPKPEEPIQLVKHCLSVLIRWGDARCLPVVLRVMEADAFALNWSILLSGTNWFWVDNPAPIVALGMRAHFAALLPAARRLCTGPRGRGRTGPRSHSLRDALASCGHPAAAAAEEMLEAAEASSIAPLGAILPPGHPRLVDAAVLVERHLAQGYVFSGADAVAYYRFTGDLALAARVLDGEGSYGSLSMAAELGSELLPLVDKLRRWVSQDKLSPLAGYAWWRVTGELELALPHLLSAGQGPFGWDVGDVWRLAHVGPPVAALAPALRRWAEDDHEHIYNNSDDQEDLRLIVRHAVRRISPETPLSPLPGVLDIDELTASAAALIP